MDEIIENENHIRDEVSSYAEQASLFRIYDSESFDKSSEYLVGLRKLKSKVIEYFKPLKKAANKAHKQITQREKGELLPIQKADELIRSMRLEYKTEQDRIVKEEQRKAEEEEKERVRKEQDSLIDKAADTEDIDTQESLLKKAQEMTPDPVFVPKEIKKTSEVLGGGTTTWIKDINVQVQDARVLCRAIADGTVPESTIEFKQGKLKQWVKMMDIRPGQIEGLLIEETSRELVRK